MLGSICFDNQNSNKQAEIPDTEPAGEGSGVNAPTR